MVGQAGGPAAARVDGDAPAGVVPLLDGDPEAVGLPADVELDEPDWLPDDAHPATAAAQVSAAAATASRPDPESPGLESPYLEYPALESLAPGSTAGPFVSRGASLRRSAILTSSAALKGGDSSRDLRSRCRFAVHRPGIPEASPRSHGRPCRGSVPMWCRCPGAVYEVSSGLVWVTGAVTHFWVT